MRGVPQDQHHTTHIYQSKLNLEYLLLTTTLCILLATTICAYINLREGLTLRVAQYKFLHNDLITFNYSYIISQELQIGYLRVMCCIL